MKERPSKIAVPLLVCAGLALLSAAQAAKRSSATCLSGPCALPADSVPAQASPHPLGSQLSKQEIEKVYGKIQFVQSFPDYKVKAVNAFEDLRVQLVTSFPDGPGKWQIVDSFPDYKIQMVDSFPDFTVKFVDSLPGINAASQTQ